MKSSFTLRAVGALAGVMAAWAVQAAPFSVTQRTSTGDEDISSWINSGTVDDLIFGGEMLSEVLGEVQWSPVLSDPFQDEEGQWLAWQEGTRSVERTMRNEHSSFDYSEFWLYDYDLPAENPTQIVITNTGALLSAGRVVGFSGYLGSADSVGEVQLLIDGQPQELEYLSAADGGDRYWRFFNSTEGEWLSNGYSQITLTTLNGAYITEASFYQADNVQFLRSEVVTSTWQEPVFQAVSVPSPVPEPSTWVLGVLGLAALGWRRN
jgi:PEP-CTERM motif